MASIFSKIVAGEIPCYKVAETDKFLAFLDVNPIAEGHVLCIPKEEIDYIFDIEDTLYNELFLFAKQVAKGMKTICPCIKIGMAVIGIDVPHTHIHLVPINKPGDMDFTTHIKMEKEVMIKLAERLSEAIAIR